MLYLKMYYVEPINVFKSIYLHQCRSSINTYSMPWHYFLSRTIYEYILVDIMTLKYNLSKNKGLLVCYPVLSLQYLHLCQTHCQYYCIGVLHHCTNSRLHFNISSVSSISSASSCSSWLSTRLNAISVCAGFGSFSVYMFSGSVPALKIAVSCLGDLCLTHFPNSFDQSSIWIFWTKKSVWCLGGKEGRCRQWCLRKTDLTQGLGNRNSDLWSNVLPLYSLMYCVAQIWGILQHGLCLWSGTLHAKDLMQNGPYMPPL